MDIVSGMFDGIISIHAPLAGSDLAELAQADMDSDFNPRSPCGERHDRAADLRLAKQISIHAPLAGSDQRRPGKRRR